MNRYRQLTLRERVAISEGRKQGLSQAAIARRVRRTPSTISRELRRNARPSGIYRAPEADQRARARRSKSRRHSYFSAEQWALIESRLVLDWSPEQIAGRLRLEEALWISHDTIYRYVRRDRRAGGQLSKHLRGASKKRRKGYGRPDSRGRLRGKRHISERPAGAENRSRFGHLEGDTVLGRPDKDCILTLVDRRSGYTIIGKLRDRTAAETTRCAIDLILAAPFPIHTITVDNGTEFHGFPEIEAATGVRFFFANPHHSWERGTSENTNGLIRQYIPKRSSMKTISQQDCHDIAHKLNHRPRERLGFLTPAEVLGLQ